MMGLPEKLPSLPRPALLRPRRLPSFLLTATAFCMVLFYTLLSIAPCMIPSSTCYRGFASSWSFDASTVQHADWMASIPDETPITSLSIPGTHDTMTYNMTDNIKLQCQNSNLTTQLESGLRYFDIRARLEDDKLRIYHANGFTGFEYDEVLLAMFDFLEAHPSEAIVMRLKEEGRPIGKGNTRTFEETFNYYLDSSPETAAGAQSHLYLYDRIRPIPTLGELRSRIFLLQEFQTKNDKPYGLAWEGDQMVLEDYWIIPDIYHLADKWTAIRDALMDAATAPLDNTKLHLAHVSASVGVLPIEAAAGPRNRTVVGMNDMTGQWLRDFEKVEGVTRTGIVILDFPGRRLVEAILDWNKRLMN